MEQQEKLFKGIRNSFKPVELDKKLSGGFPETLFIKRGILLKGFP